MEKTVQENAAAVTSCNKSGFLPFLVIYDRTHMDLTWGNKPVHKIKNSGFLIKTSVKFSSQHIFWFQPGGILKSFFSYFCISVSSFVRFHKNLGRSTVLVLVKRHVFNGDNELFAFKMPRSWIMLVWRTV